MYKLTKERALLIQELHIQHYADYYPGGAEALRRKLNSISKADRLESGVLYHYDEMHEYIPRAHTIVHDLIGARNFFILRSRIFPQAV